MEKIKSLGGGKCPHCSKEILIEMVNIPAQVAGIFSEENFKEAKIKVIEAIKEMKISEEEKTQAITWVGGEGIIFGPNEVDEIIKNIQKEHNVK